MRARRGRGRVVVACGWEIRLCAEKKHDLLEEFRRSLWGAGA